ncbi:methenyltetrahydrofolate cyclohydrolase [Desulfonispora thiosulfatigenes DSM 11270]|uniref:Bifunctional protein FolD n=1 Tax=Desulfonispora thiosulfatigenes DSM 11270 TaxID=656914 RepID=A0A1W1UQ29_DESTI|nr:bifunctional methylenetetrahydrofolate dehydrogenase/methenyltetrahydrofolate cyclohydrolase FolD [Desulfonispora thiosulfatigenes]SMB83143.1 methenyltetrahydrofolate cyclohydrolase [Desulfonispora thiosulfatigenes DSM 11270]
MEAKLISGKEISQKIRTEIKEKVQALKANGVIPGLAVVLVGEDPASKVYVASKEKACTEVGMHSEIHRISESTSQNELIDLIDKLNKDSKIHGILVQLPLPKHLDEKEVILKISPEKDVDGFHPINTGKLLVGEKTFEACTPKGCMRLIKETGIEIAGKKAVVVGRSNIVGKPIALMLLAQNATVTICHSKTKNLSEEIKAADILIAAIGKPNFITAEMIKPGAIVIDVGINRLENGKLTGDVEFEGAKEVASFITPVPGGVGPMTIAMLLENTLEAAQSI